MKTLYPAPIRAHRVYEGGIEGNNELVAERIGSGGFAQKGRCDDHRVATGGSRLRGGSTQTARVEMYMTEVGSSGPGI
jgi:hypothetical protein